MPACSSCSRKWNIFPSSYNSLTFLAFKFVDLRKKKYKSNQYLKTLDLMRTNNGAY